jgi:hypothetical protein
MVFYKTITIIFLLFTKNVSLQMPERIHDSFIKYDKKSMFTIFPNLYKYLDSKSETSDYNHKEMLDTYKSIYKDACVYLLNKKNSSLYLGWVPLRDDVLLKKYYKNITKKIDFETNVKNVPLYFIVCEAISSNNTMQAKKILCNPTIDLSIDLSLLKAHLLNLTKEYNTTLDLSPLKTYDSGRWYLIFNYL